MRNQRGITLVALVVTIVVLLILAGTSIAMLSGDNGIITNAQNSNYANTEGEVMDKIKLAYNTISTSVMVNGATDLTYDPTTQKSLIDLGNIALADLGETADLSDTKMSTTKTDGHYYVSVDSTNKKITIGYQDKYFKTTINGSNEEVVATGAKFKEIKYEISVDTDKATLGTYVRQVKTN